MSDAPTGDDLTVTHRGRRDASSPTLVLLHGLTDSGACWPDALRRWEHDFHVVTVDARGHGESPRWDDRHLAAGVGETMRDDTVAVLEDLRRQPGPPPVLIGHSMGGATAWAVATARPDLVGALVLEDPSIPQHEGEPGPQEPADGGPEEPPRGPRLWQWPDIELAPWERSKQQVDGRMVATGRTCVDVPWPQAWRSITVPTLVVTGTDAVIIGAHRRRQIDELGNGRIRVAVVAHAGHCVRRCNPEGYHAVVDPFLARVTGTGTGTA